MDLVLGVWYRFYTTSSRDDTQIGELVEMTEAWDGVRCTFRRPGSLTAGYNGIPVEWVVGRMLPEVNLLDTPLFGGVPEEVKGEEA